MDQKLAPRLDDPALDGRHDFDFLLGTWRIACRQKVKLFIADDTGWREFAATAETRTILSGLGNLETFVAPASPGRPGVEAVTLRLFEPETGLWRNWWGSTLHQGFLDPPFVGHFTNGSGRFECIDTVGSRAVKLRFDWTDITQSSACGQQSFSFDDGRSWHTNMIWQLVREVKT